MAYDHKEIEKKAQEKWAELDLYRTDLSNTTKDPYYLLVEFPYPSGDLHIGHWYAFSVTDIYARMLRLRGKNVLFPIGFDAFGLPAENAAIKHGANPKDWTYQNIERMRTQLQSMGASFDWSKEVIACDPSYYQWTQWLFTKLFEHKLAERREAAVKWCPKDQTVLANEQVVDGKCERCGTEVEEKRLTQWLFKITDYAERLLTGLDNLPWREEIKDAQRAWIGKSEGAKLTFALNPELQGSTLKFIEVFTTRPDTIFGVTYIVLAPEHPLVAPLLASISNKKEVEKYIKATTKKTERERSENKEKTGTKLEGVSAINPATKEEIPIYVADYVLASYGTGAVMAVPAHDERDFEFAKRYDLPIRQVVAPLFVATADGADKIREGLPFVERDAIIAVVKHATENKFLLLKWKKVAWHTFVTGGIENGQTPEEAARAEVREETGYKNLKLIRNLGVLHSQFYHPPKGENRFGHIRTLYFELENDERDELALGENDKHEFLWVDAAKVDELLTAPAHKYVFSQILYEHSYTGTGLLDNSGEFSGRDSTEAMSDIVKFVCGDTKTQYRIRDWLVSRQRYWGCPIPIVYDPEGNPHTIPSEHLPWLLPTDVDFKPTGKAPLASSNELRERVTKIFGEGWTPEYDTLDTFVDSSWYFLRYLDPKDSHDFSDASLMKKWLPINRYSGGSEHTTMHLLYARFFMKALYDLALVPVDEPFVERFNRGLILGPDGHKMSKSKGNVINPDEFVEKYGADAVRIYLAFIGPYNEPGSYPWNLDGVTSMRKFLERIYRLTDRVDKTEEVPSGISDALAHAINKVANDGDKFKFNTCISALMVLVNALEASPIVPRETFKSFLIILAPFAPHLSEHLWEKLGEAKTAEGGSPDGAFRANSVHQQPWPEANATAISECEVVVQVNGKRRGEVLLSVSATEEEASEAARALPAVAAALDGNAPKRVVYVAGRIINFVV